MTTSSFSHSKIAIVGAGLMGRLLAIALAKRGAQVELFDKGGPDASHAAARIAAAMLAPLAESAITEDAVVRMGIYSLPRWKSLIKDLSTPVYFQQDGTLILWHRQDGVPTGFTVTDSTNVAGKLFVGKDAPVLTSNGMILSNHAMTSGDAPNVLLGQSITVDPSGTTYNSTVTVGINGSWTRLNVANTTTTIDRLATGQYLMTVTFAIDSAQESMLSVSTNGRGYDFASAPKTITTRLLLTAGKTQILAQAVSISGTADGASS